MSERDYFGDEDMPGDGLSELLGRALTDSEFRTLLFDSRNEATRDFRLSRKDLEALDGLDRVELEDAAEKLMGRVMGKKNVTIKIQVTKSF